MKSKEKKKMASNLDKKMKKDVKEDKKMMGNMPMKKMKTDKY